MRWLAEIGALGAAGAVGAGAGYLVELGGSSPARAAVALGLGAGLAAGQLVIRKLAPSDVAVTSTTFSGSSGPARRFLEDRVAEATDPAERWSRLTTALGEQLELAAGLSQVRLFAYADEEAQLVSTDSLGADPQSRVVIDVDPRARTWLTVNSGPLVASRLGNAALGGLRRPIEELVKQLGGDLVLPLVYYDRLVGIAIGTGVVRRALEGDAVRAVQRDAAGALGELRLRAEAQEQAQVAAEVDEAAAMHNRNVGTRMDDLAGCRVVRHYLPAHQCSGAWWSSAELPDGRLFAAIGEVTGRGVAAALLSATAVGVCEAAREKMGAGMSLDILLELLHDAVRKTARGAFSMTCCALIVDREAQVVSFASAGHPFPYLCRPSGDSKIRGEIRSLVSRGALLGGPDRPVFSLGTRDITSGDIIVLHSASLTNVQNDEGETFGERRMQHFLRRATIIGATSPDGAQLAEQIGTTVAEFIGMRELEDDVGAATIEVLA